MNTQEEKKTPLALPLRVVVDDFAEEYADVYDADGDMLIVNLTKEEATYICKAINSHFELLKGCRMAFGRLHDYLGHDDAVTQFLEKVISKEVKP